MKPRVVFAILLLAIGLVVAQYALLQRSHAAARQLILRLIPYGQLSYEKLWPWFWAAGNVWGLAFEPAGLVQLNLHTPNGYRVSLRELHIRRLDPGWIDGRPSVRGSLEGLSFPVQERRSPPPDPSRPAAGGLPTLHELTYRKLEFDVDFSAEFIPEAKLLLLHFEGDGESVGRFKLFMQLEGDAATFKRAPDQIVLRRLDLQFADGGLLHRYRETAAARRGLGPDELMQALGVALDLQAQSPSWTWDPQSTQALREGLRKADSFRVRLDPPGKIYLRNIRLYRPRAWGADLGFSLGVNKGEPAQSSER